MDFEVNSDVRIDEFVSFKYRIKSVLRSFPEVAHLENNHFIQLKRKLYHFRLREDILGFSYERITI